MAAVDRSNLPAPTTSSRTFDGVARYELLPGGGVIADTTAPAVGSFSPSAASSIARASSITFDVTDLNGFASIIVLASQGSDPVEVVHYAASFVGPFAAGSTRDPVAGGYTYSVARAGGWQRSALTITVIATDSRGNVTSTSVGYTVTDPPGAPTVDTYVPANPSSISKTTPVAFKVHDETGLLRVFVLVTYSSGIVEVIHDGSAFQAPFTGSSRSASVDGFDYAVSRTGYWPAAGVAISIVAIDGQGNQTAATYTLTVTDPPPPNVAAPVVSNVTPTATPSNPISPTTVLGLDVTDDSGALLRVFIYATFSGGSPAEVVYDGDAFLPYYSAASSVGAITDGVHFDVARAGGWPSSPTLKVFPIDNSGMEG